ncbi:hypothetical protein A2Y83_03900, partial [Candidatus Falkowbacteria bacterium RBG_13_39_14]
MDIDSIKKFLEKIGEPKYRLMQIIKAVYKDRILNFDEITTIPKNLRDALFKSFKILPFDEEKIFNTRITPLQKGMRPIKSLLRLADGNKIETVILPNENGWTACISTQAGCALGCKFCATGKMGFKRNLTSEEIADQILYWRGLLQVVGDMSTCRLRVNSQHCEKEACLRGQVRCGITNIVYMGMGEPFLNWENTKKSLKNLTDKNMFAFGSRSISISTAGIPDGIINFAKNFPQMNLAVSLHAANDKKRSELMPINKKHNLNDLKNAILEYFKLTN